MRMDDLGQLCPENVKGVDRKSISRNVIPQRNRNQLYGSQVILL